MMFSVQMVGFNLGFFSFYFNQLNLNLSLNKDGGTFFFDSVAGHNCLVHWKASYTYNLCDTFSTRLIFSLLAGQ